MICKDRQLNTWNISHKLLEDTNSKKSNSNKQNTCVVSKMSFKRDNFSLLSCCNIQLVFLNDVSVKSLGHMFMTDMHVVFCITVGGWFWRFRGCQVSRFTPPCFNDIQRPGEIPDTFGNMSFLEVLVPWIYKGNSKRYWNFQVGLVQFGSSISFAEYIYIYTYRA